MKKFYTLLLLIIFITSSAQGVFGGKFAIRDTSGVTKWWNTNTETCDGSGDGSLHNATVQTYNVYLGDRFYLGGNVLAWGFPSTNSGAFAQWRYYQVGGSVPAWSSALNLPWNLDGICSNSTNKKFQYVPADGQNIIQCTSEGSYRLDVNLVGYQNGNNYSVYVSGNYVPFNVQPLGTPSSFTATCSSDTQINLNWTRWNNRDVIILRNTTGNFTHPNQGSTYNAGNTIGESTVIYRGNLTSLSDTNLAPNTTYYYRIYSENWSYYSASASSSAITKPNPGTITGNTTVCRNKTQSYTVTNATGVSYNWSVPSGWLIDSGQGTNSINVTTGSSGGNISVTATNSCGVSNASTLSVNVTQDWANIQVPKNDITVVRGQGWSQRLFIQFRTCGVTYQSNTEDSDVTAWVGYSTEKPTSLSSFTTDKWTWIEAPFFEGQTVNPGVNDEYYLDNFGQIDGHEFTDTPGTYYFVSRFQVNGETTYTYGGNDGSLGSSNPGPWNGTTNVERKIIVTDCTPTTWNGTAWSPSAPDLTKKAIISGVYNTAVQPNIDACACEISSNGNLTVTSGKYVNIKYEYNNSGTVTVESDANLVQLKDYSLNIAANPKQSEIQNSGNIIVKRTATVPPDQYNYWSSPVKNQNMYSIYPNVPSNTVMTYNTFNDFFTVLQNPATSISGKGYSIEGPATGGPLVEATFTNAPHNAYVDILLSTSVEGNYNLVGNPYASNLDLDLLYSQNTSINPTFWFWDNIGNDQLYQMGSAYNSYVKNNYATYNAASVSGVPGTAAPDGSAKIPNGIVKPGQGFIVEAKSANNLRFSNKQRTYQTVKNSTSSVYFKSLKSAGANIDRFWIELVNPDGLYNTQAIVYLDNASNNFDVFDSENANYGSDLFYSFADNSNLQFAIQGREKAKLVDDIIPLGTQHFKAGNYKIRLGTKQGVFAAGQAIYIYDILNKTYTNLQNEAFIYNGLPGNLENRFQIVYKQQTQLAVNDLKKSELVIYRDADNFVVEANNKIKYLEIYDGSGRLIKHQKGGDKKLVVNSEGLVRGLYFVKVYTEDLVRTKKIIK